MSAIVKSAAGVAVGGIAVGGSLTIIPLTPVLIGAGIVAGTIVTVNLIRSSSKLKMAQLQTQTGDDKFYIQSFAGTFYSVDPNEDYRLTAKRQIQEFEYFQMLKTNDGRFAFRAAKNQHVAVVQSKGGLLVANQSEIRESDLFTLEEHKDSFVAFKSSNGKYISFGGKDSESLKVNATSVGESELFRILIMKDQVTITKTIEIGRSVTVNIGVHNYEEIAKHHKGWFIGTTLYWAFPDKTKQKIRSKIKEMLDEKLKSRIEAAINDALDAQLGQEVTKEIQAELADQKIKAAVVTIVK